MGEGNCYVLCRVHHQITGMSSLRLTYLNSLGLPGVNVGDSVVLFLMESDSFNVVKHTQEMGLNGMGVRSLSEDFKKGGV